MPFDSAGFPSPSPVADILRKARQLIADGWCQRDSVAYDARSKTFSYCALGAISAAGNLRTARNLAFVYLTSAISPQAVAIPHWNDHPRRTQEEVLAAFDKAIELAEEEAHAPVSAGGAPV